MQIAIIADTHMPRRARELPVECVEIIEKSDLAVHAGDVSTAEILEAIRAIGPPVVAVRGNVDSEELRRLLPEREVVEPAGVRIGVIHDAGPAKGRLGRMRREFPDADAVVFGHSHIPWLETDGRFQIFNPGSPTDRRRSPQFTMGVAVIEEARIAFEHVVVRCATRPPA
jgi:putative phosphoesterase